MAMQLCMGCLQELGMVNTILSDKTGTLARNVMEFFKGSIAGVAYGQGVTEIERASARRWACMPLVHGQPHAAQWAMQPGTGGPQLVSWGTACRLLKLLCVPPCVCFPASLYAASSICCSC